MSKEAYKTSKKQTTKKKLLYAIGRLQCQKRPIRPVKEPYNLEKEAY